MAKKIKIFLADLTYTQQTIAADIMPQAIGSIGSYLQTNLDFDSSVKLFKYPEKLITSLENDNLPDIIGFSNYIWNFRLSYEICKIIKKKHPKIITVFGGPNFPIVEEEFKNFLLSHSKIDFYVQKEGEIAFLNLVKIALKNNFNIERMKKNEIKSVFSLGKDNILNIPETEERIVDLSVVPSPYTTGILDEFFDGKLTPIIQTNRGCPFSCTFCVEGLNYYNKIRKNSLSKLSSEIMYIGKKMKVLRKKGGRNDLFIADSNFGMYKDDISFSQELAKSRKQYNWPEYINVATGKNQKERVLEASKIIDGALRLSGSIQSLDEEVLKNVKRANISADGLMDLALSAQNVGANSYSEIILGLPGDSKKKHINSVKTVIESGFTNVLLFQLMILPGTELATLETKKKFKMNLKNRVLPRCYGYYKLFGKDIIAAEIEEICVGTSTLSFEDYLECRKMHLMVSIFYNDGIFGSIIKLLKSLNISIWEWIELLCKNTPPKKLYGLFFSFEKATIKELWSSKRELVKFTSTKKNINKFLNGEIGNNLLFTYKTKAINDFNEPISDFVKKTTIKLLKNYKMYNKEIDMFITDCVNYHLLSMKNLFKENEKVPSGKFIYDIKKFMNTKKFKGIKDFHYNKSEKLDFVHNENQINIIRRYLELFGNSDVGIGRILTKVHTKKLMRAPAQKDFFADTHPEELNVSLSGLQN